MSDERHGRRGVELSNGPVVVGWHGDHQDDDALLTAVAFARRLGASVRVVHAVDLDDFPVDPEGADWEQAAEEHLREGREHVAGVLEGSAVSWNHDQVRGDAAEVLADLAAEVGAVMVVVGIRRGGLGERLREAVLGTLGQRLGHRAAMPVLLVPSE